MADTTTPRKAAAKPGRKPKRPDHFPFGLFNILNLLGGGHTGRGEAKKGGRP